MYNCVCVLPFGSSSLSRPRNAEAPCDIRPPTTCSQGLALPGENVGKLYAFTGWWFQPLLKI